MRDFRRWEGLVSANYSSRVFFFFLFNSTEANCCHLVVFGCHLKRLLIGVWRGGEEAKGVEPSLVTSCSCQFQFPWCISGLTLEWKEVREAAGTVMQREGSGMSSCY